MKKQHDSTNSDYSAGLAYSKAICKMSLSDLKPLNADNVDKVYSRLYMKWRFINSDKVWMNGKLLKDKSIIKIGDEIAPDLKIEPSDMQDGFPLKEKVFVEEELKKYEIMDNQYIYDLISRTEKNRLKTYLNFLNKRLTELETDREPENIEIDKINEVENKHSHIFNSNAFYVWQKMFDEFKIKKSSRSDVKFMFEEMKKDGLIHDTVSQTAFLNWINDTYELTIEKTSNYSKTAAREAVYNNAKTIYIK